MKRALLAAGRRAARPMILAGLLTSLLGACDFGIRLSGKPPATVGSGTRPPAFGSATPAVPANEVIGDTPPQLAAPKAFDPKPPEVFQGPGGITVWLVQRPDLPIVSATFVVPYGSASDPEDAPGTMALLADMLDEGAGSRDALQVSETVASLGATLSLGASLDGSTASVLSLRSKFDTTFEILCDVVARPHLEKTDFQRTKKLWKNALKKRMDDPMSVASVVGNALLYGAKTPYGHPSLGLYSKADNVGLQGLKNAYAKTWRPDKMGLVVVGQITKKDLEAALEKQLGNWRPKGDAMVQPTLGSLQSKRPHFVLVDRPKAVQTVLLVIREGVAAADEHAPDLALVNDALGGSFTSRLNQNLREDKGWTYGVGSGFSTTRGQGSFGIRTSVEAAHTGEALKEILNELAKISEGGLTEEEVAKVKAGDRANQVETYEGVTGTGSRLSQLATLGLPPAFDAGASRIRQAASKGDLARLSKMHLEPPKFTVVLVGDRETIKQQLAAQKFDAPQVYGPEGQPL